MDDFLHRLLFASDAQWFALAGAGLVIVAVLAQLIDRFRQNGRSVESMDKITLVPWTNLSIVLGLLGGCLLMFSLPAVLGNL